MKVYTSVLLFGAASAAVAPQQHVFQLPKLASDAWTKPFHNLQQQLKSFTAEARVVWDEVAMMFPEAMEKASFFSPPKKHRRRPDSEWDYIVSGADVQSVWVENAVGGKERDVDGKLETYNLRAKKVDPSVLGVDPGVKQYSGYLDDEENDKHLFYCEWRTANVGLYRRLTHDRVL